VPRTTIQINLRLKPDLRAALQAAADARGVSMTREITERLENSLKPQNQYGPLHAGPDAFRIGLALGETLEFAGQRAAQIAAGANETPPDWLDHPYAYQQAVEAVDVVLRVLAPRGDVVPPDSFPESYWRTVGEAAGCCLALAETMHGRPSDPSAQAADRTHWLRSVIGPLCDRRRAEDAKIKAAANAAYTAKQETEQ
jgi:hypothetical protein